MMGRPGGSMVKIHLPMQEMQIRSLGWEDAQEKGVATHSNGEIPWTESLVGYNPWGHKELDTTQWLHAWSEPQNLLWGAPLSTQLLKPEQSLSLSLTSHIQPPILFPLHLRYFSLMDGSIHFPPAPHPTLSPWWHNQWQYHKLACLDL